MKKLIVSFVIVVLLTACQSAAPAQNLPTPISNSAPIITETLADSVNLVQGLWYNASHSGLTMSINGDGESSNLTYSVYEMAGFYPVSQGTAKFEDGKFTYLTDKIHCINSPQATYEIYIIKEDGFITGMRQKLVGTDGCVDRMDANSSIYHYSGVSAIPEGVERPPKTGGELFGFWYAEGGLFLNYHFGKIDLETGNAEIAIDLYYTGEDPWQDAGTGTAKYENGKLTFLTNEGLCGGTPEVTYEISMVVRNDKVIAMHPKVVGDDLCADRKNIFDNQIIRRVNVNP